MNDGGGAAALIDVARELLLPGVEIDMDKDDVDRPIADPVRLEPLRGGALAPGPWLAERLVGDWTIAVGLRSPSCH